ncbi:MAG: hypothetical protein U0172_14980 [Nitrospiraceae bacterium]
MSMVTIGIGAAAVALAVGLSIRAGVVHIQFGGSEKTSAATQPTAAVPSAPAIPVQTDVYAVPVERVFRFPGVTGPTSQTTVASAQPTATTTYETGGQSRMAILLTDPEANWLGLAHGLKSIGVPFVVTTDAKKALQHRVVMVYPLISGRVLSPEALKALAAHPRQGGTLIATDILGGGLEEVFGFAEMRTTKDHYALRLATGSPLLTDFTDPAEQTIPLGNREKGMQPIPARAYLETRESALATYDDGTTAITQRSYGVGHAYAIGIDLGYLLLKGHNLRDEGIARSYDNEYEPGSDVFLRLLANMYRHGEPNAVVVHPAPFNKQLSVLLTHDIDAQTSMANARQFAEFERSQGIVGTYFVQTKYVKDYNDEIFFNDQGVKDMAALHTLGMELGSHTVAHSKVLSHFPLGTGAERYPDYTPYVKTRKNAANGSILGELRVSKFLVERLSGGAHVESFRPGELSNPAQLPQALTATGYRYSSSATANNSLTHLPYQLMVDHDVRTESEVFEFPVTIEDEALPEMGSRVPEALAVAKKISRYGGSVVVLIHPNILGHKMEFEKAFVGALKGTAWFGSVGQFGAWWKARNAAQVDVRADGGRRVVSITAPDQIDGLTLQLPATWRPSGKGLDRRVKSFDGGRLVLNGVKGAVELTFEVAPDAPTHPSFTPAQL